MNDQLCVLPHDIERLAQDGHYLCPGHVKALPDRILQLADLHDQLANNLISQGAPVERRSKSEAVGISLSPKVIELRDAIKNELAGWARIVCEDRGVHYSATDNIHSIAAFLVTHADWICAQPFVDDLWTQLVYDPRGEVTRSTDTINGELVTVITDTRALRTQARSLLQPSGTRRMDIGHERCLDVTCDGFLVAVVRDTDELLPSKVWCEGCGQEWPAGSWLTLGRKIRGTAHRVIGDQLVDLEAIATQINLARRTLRRHMNAVACDLRTKRRLYRLEDAAELIDKITPRRRKP